MADETIKAALDALQVRFADGQPAGIANSLHLVIDEEGPEALVATVLDALEDDNAEYVAARRAVLEAARAWVGRITDPPSQWADQDDRDLIAAVQRIYPELRTRLLNDPHAAADVLAKEAG